MPSINKLLQAAAGNAGGDNLYVEDVFSTYLYVGGNGSGTNQAVNVVNDVNLNEEGGLIWIKRRDVGNEHALIDTERGNAQWLNSNSTAAATSVTSIDSFNTDGFTVSSTGYGSTNNPDADYASWTFRKAEKFFDVVTYTGDGVAGRTVAHNLGSVPGMVIVKSTNANVNWEVYHKSLGNTHEIRLNQTTAALDDVTKWNDTTPTDSVFTVGTDNTVNNNGWTYVAYLFASDAGCFGDDGDENIIKCGSYTGNPAGVEVDLGFEPQWVLVKPSSTTGNWDMADVMRGATAEKTATFDGNWAELTANTSAAEIARDATITPRATGMFIKDNGLSNTGDTYIYIAIRRPMKTPESGTEVFNDTFQYGEDGKTAGYLGSPADLDIRIERTGGGSLVRDRLRGDVYLRTQATDAEAGSQSATWDNMTGYFYYSPGTSANTDIIHYVFKRATGFFDMVAYTGDRVSQGGPQTITHNLKVIPELAIVKVRSDSASWYVASTELNNYDFLSLNTANSANSDSVTPYIYDLEVNNFKVGARNQVNATGDTYISYLFATVAGVSKVGSYTGTAADLNVDCGFSAGARFILIKRTDYTGNWYVWDSARGIVAGNDPHLSLNTTAAQVTTDDSIDPNSSGFIVNQVAATNINVSSASYIYLSIA